MVRDIAMIGRNIDVERIGARLIKKNVAHFQVVAVGFRFSATVGFDITHRFTNAAIYHDTNNPNSFAAVLNPNVTQPILRIYSAADLELGFRFRFCSSFPLIGFTEASHQGFHPENKSRNNP